MHQSVSKPLNFELDRSLRSASNSPDSYYDPKDPRHQYFARVGPFLRFVSSFCVDIFCLQQQHNEQQQMPRSLPTERLDQEWDRFAGPIDPHKRCVFCQHNAKDGKVVKTISSRFQTENSGLVTGDCVCKFHWRTLSTTFTASSRICKKRPHLVHHALNSFEKVGDGKLSIWCGLCRQQRRVANQAQ